MFEIIPNWHPIFVHYSVGLLSLSVILFVITPLVRAPLREQWQIVARWSLWFGVAITLITGATGIYAYNTVAHDGPSHLAMTEHRNWALITIVVFIVLAIWSVVRVRAVKSLGVAFVIGMVVAGGLLCTTAWHGGELVYRHGLGVMSLPQSSGDGHDHQHADGQGHDHGAGEARGDHHDTIDEMDFSGMDEMMSGDDDAMSGMDFSGMDEMMEKDGHDHHDHQH